MTEAPAFPGNFVETAQTLDRATIDALREAVALGRWPNGAKLSKEQQGLCLEAVLAWEHRHLPPEEHTGYVPSPQDACASTVPGAYAPSLARRRVSGELTHRATGTLEKMRATVEGDGTVAYRLPLGDSEISLNPLLGRRLQLRFEDAIYCTACGRKTNKSFNQGYCFPCFQKLAACDSCIVSPEKCHFAAGTCREPSWAEQFCMTDHWVYLANSTGLKVGITRGNQVPTRWLDQGASAAVLFARTATRHLAGLVEVILKAHAADRTQWQRLLKGPPEPVDLLEAREQLWETCGEALTGLQQAHGLQAVQRVTGPELWQAAYPVTAYPAKVKALALEKLGTVEGTLEGIKGQYLLLTSGVINIRKYTAHQVAFSRPRTKRPPP